MRLCKSLFVRGTSWVLIMTCLFLCLCVCLLLCALVFSWCVCMHDCAHACMYACMGVCLSAQRVCMCRSYLGLHAHIHTPTCHCKQVTELGVFSSSVLKLSLMRLFLPATELATLFAGPLVDGARRRLPLPDGGRTARHKGLFGVYSLVK